MSIIIIFHGYRVWLGSTSQFLLSFSHAVIDSGWGWDHLKPAHSYMWHQIKKTWSAGGSLSNSMWSLHMFSPQHGFRIAGLPTQGLRKREREGEREPDGSHIIFFGPSLGGQSCTVISTTFYSLRHAQKSAQFQEEGEIDSRRHWWGNGSVWKSMWGQKYCCSHFCKIQSATPSSFQRSSKGVPVTKTGFFLRTPFWAFNKWINGSLSSFLFFVFLAWKIFK